MRNRTDGKEEGVVTPKFIICRNCQEVIGYKPHFGKIKCPKCKYVIETKWVRF